MDTSGAGTGGTARSGGGGQEDNRRLWRAGGAPRRRRRLEGAPSPVSFYLKTLRSLAVLWHPSIRLIGGAPAAARQSLRQSRASARSGRRSPPPAPPSPCPHPPHGGPHPNRAPPPPIPSPRSFRSLPQSSPSSMTRRRWRCLRLASDATRSSARRGGSGPTSARPSLPSDGCASTSCRPACSRGSS